jgi:hypothetical protein
VDCRWFTIGSVIVQSIGNVWPKQPGLNVSASVVTAGVRRTLRSLDESGWAAEAAPD